LPVWAGIGAIAALVANLTIAVEKVVPAGGEAPEGGAQGGDTETGPASPQQLTQG